MKYFLEHAGEQWVAERVPAGVRLNDADRRAEIAWLGPDEVLLTLDGENHRVFARRTPEGWRLSIRGRTFDIVVEDERTHAIRELAGAGDPLAGPRELRAPMPGLVVRVLVEPGQIVAPGDGLVVVEAMKMENELRAEGPGTVADVAAKPGEAVDRDDILITFEAEPS